MRKKLPLLAAACLLWACFYCPKAEASVFIEFEATRDYMDMFGKGIVLSGVWCGTDAEAMAAEVKDRIFRLKHLDTLQKIAILEEFNKSYDKFTRLMENAPLNPDLCAGWDEQAYTSMEKLRRHTN